MLRDITFQNSIPPTTYKISKFSIYFLYEYLTPPADYTIAWHLLCNVSEVSSVLPTRTKSTTNLKISCVKVLCGMGDFFTVSRMFCAGLGIAFFSVQNVPFFSLLLKNATFFSVLFLSFWRLIRLKRTQERNILWQRT